MSPAEARAGKFTSLAYWRPREFQSPLMGMPPTTGLEQPPHHQQSHTKGSFGAQLLAPQETQGDGNERRAMAGGFEILLGPRASMHGARVPDGCRLHYVWLDFFDDKEGKAWLQMHQPIGFARPSLVRLSLE